MRTTRHNGQATRFPSRAAAAIALAPILVIATFLFVPGPAWACGLVAAMVSTALSAWLFELAAFPANARGILEHRFTLARCEGTSWFAEMREEGRCALLTLDRESSTATQQRDRAHVLFLTLAFLHAALVPAILTGAVAGRFAWAGALWAAGVAAMMCAGLALLAHLYRAQDTLGPDEQKIVDAAKLHLRCDQERRAELVALVKKS